MHRIAFAFLALTVSLCAQTKFEYWPGTAYDPAVPTQKQVIGYDTGERVSSPEAIVHYLEALAAARPDRVKLRDYGKTWEGRRLVYAIVGSPANIKRLDEIKTGLAKLGDPRKTTDAEADKLIANLPVPL
jgi:hypothetical protein